MTDPKQAMEVLKQKPFTVILADSQMPGMNGREFLSFCKRESPSCVRILITGYHDVAHIMEAVNQAEIYKYVSKPWTVRDLNIILNRAILKFHEDQQINLVPFTV